VSASSAHGRRAASAHSPGDDPAAARRGEVVVICAIGVPSGEQIRRSLSGRTGPAPEWARAYARLATALKEPSRRVRQGQRSNRPEGSRHSDRFAPSCATGPARHPGLGVARELRVIEPGHDGVDGVINGAVAGDDEVRGVHHPADLGFVGMRVGGVGTGSFNTSCGQT
jgi:hypothetical protein